MIKRIIFWRHGQTDQNVARRIQGASDVPLNARGVAQAAAAAAEIVKLAPTAILVSDLSRARQTAKPVAEFLGIEPILDVRLRERSYGLWEGKTSEEISREYHEQWLAWRSGVDPVGVGVETRADCGKRVAEAISDCVFNSRNITTPETYLVVSHGGAITAGILTLLGLNPSRQNVIQGMDNCHWAVLDARPNATPAWRLYSYNRICNETD